MRKSDPLKSYDTEQVDMPSMKSEPSKFDYDPIKNVYIQEPNNRARKPLQHLIERHRSE
jgi:hypothetical protein